MSQVLWPLALVVTVAVAYKDWDYVVNDLFDDSLSEMKIDLLKQSGGYVDLGSVTIAGYALEGAKLGDLATLRRHGNVTISSSGTVVRITGYVELPNMIVSGGNITSLDMNILNPVISFNGFDGFFFDFWSNVQDKSCANGYLMERKYWTRGTVRLTSETEEYADIDITNFVQLHETDFTITLSAALSNAFGSYFGFCDTVIKLQVG